MPEPHAECKPTPYATVNEAAGYIRVHERTIRRWLRSGQLPSYKLGSVLRLKYADLDALLAAPTAKK